MSNKRVPVFNYTSECCKSPAIKEPCEKAVAVVRKGKKSVEEHSSLGHWHCSSCGRGCKVSRNKREE